MSIEQFFHIAIYTTIAFVLAYWYELLIALLALLVLRRLRSLEKRVTKLEER